MIKPGIYLHVDPFTHEIRYVGRSTNWPKRSREHLRPNRLNNSDTHHARWLKQLLARGVRPTILLLQEFPKTITEAQLNEAEIYYISYFKQLGCPLTNATSGGEGHPISEESKAKIRAKLLKPKKIKILKPLSHAQRVNNQSLKRAIQDQNGNTYPSIKEAARTLDIPFTKIADIVRERRNSCRGYKFTIV